jgi:hypothetical protein
VDLYRQREGRPKATRIAIGQSSEIAAVAFSVKSFILAILLTVGVLQSAQATAPLSMKRSSERNHAAKSQYHDAPGIPLNDSQASAKEHNRHTDRQQTSITPRESTGLGTAEIIAVIAVVEGLIQAVVMRQTLVYANRPYVHLKAFDRPEPVHHVSQSAEPSIIAWRVAPTWENSGNTPTVNVRNWVNWAAFTGRDGIPTGFDFPDIISGNVVRPAKLMIGPKNFISANLLDIEVNYLTVAWHGGLRIYIWGWTEYRDDFWFSRLHRSEFCNEIVVEGDPANAECRFRFAIGHEHNGSGRSECYRPAGTKARRVQRGSPVWPLPHDTLPAP